MTPMICTACGTQFPATPKPPERCPICHDSRQFIPPSGQGWTTLEALKVSHANSWRQLRAGLYEIHTQPAFGIGQRALLMQTEHGNFLWDCVALLDDATVSIVKALGGLDAIAISHPHYYTTMIEWARAFDCPVYLHEADEVWVMRKGDSLRYWNGDRLVLDDATTLLRVGGHFPGGTILFCEADDGVLLTGDVLQVTPDRSHVSFMYSYPNYLPLDAKRVKAIGAVIEKLVFGRVYGSFLHAQIESDAKAAVMRSVERYVALLEGRYEEHAPDDPGFTN
ncbi:MBL fold metallo-hydrolase [Paraburkholderia sp. BR10872]|uniref:MBL fold metallo-hydrolase n=1 Tax=Paraburkholderia sp. BR10872 TaxID=3236989 RepID=UPI0034D18B47